MLLARYRRVAKSHIDRRSEITEGVSSSHVLRHIGCRIGGNGGRAGALALLLAEALAVRPLLPPPPPSW